jgi:peptide/nickel transport system permease protein
VSAIPIPRPWGVRLRANPTTVAGVAIIALVVLLAIFAGWVWPVDPLEQNIADRLMAPSAEHPLGTDSFGRDVLARLLHAARISLGIGVLAIALAMTVGSAIGIAAGYIGGWFDSVVTSLLDVLLSSRRCSWVSWWWRCWGPPSRTWCSRSR